LNKSEDVSKSSMKMIPTFVTNLPTGNELGSFYALDLGGTNFRVIKLELYGEKQLKQTNSKKFRIPEDKMQGPGVKLFDFIADCVAEFLAEETSPHTEKILGFTFSFPVKQTSINSGILIHWTKGFSAAGVEGQDVCKLLDESFKRKSMRVKIAALANDTVGTMLAQAYLDPLCHVGLILGTGANAAYMENIDQIGKWTGPKPPSGKMAINMEWGGFASNNKRSVLPTTKFDEILDKESKYPGQQAYEKMLSGMYLGELSRLILVELIKGGHLFGGNLTSALFNKSILFTTEFMSKFEVDDTETLVQIRTILETLGVTNSTKEDRRIVKEVCHLVAERAAKLSAAGIAAIIKQIHKQDGCTVAVDGSVFTNYPFFPQMQKQALLELLGDSAQNVRLVATVDGSGNGAALVAALS